MKKSLTYGTGLIALYLGVFYASGSTSLLKQGAIGGIGIIRALQGR